MKVTFNCSLWDEEHLVEVYEDKYFVRGTSDDIIQAAFDEWLKEKTQCGWWHTDEGKKDVVQVP